MHLGTLSTVLFIASDVEAETATRTAAATGATDIASLVFIVVFALGFVALAVAFLRKKRKERLEVLSRASEEAALEHGIDERGQLTEGGEAAPVPSAEELVAAEKAAKAALAEEDRARRARERAEEAARSAVDEDATQKLEAAKAKEAEAKAAAQDAKERARQLERALTKTRDGFVGRISKAFGGRSIDEDVLDELESILFTSDIGARTAERLLEAVRKRARASDLADSERVQTVLKGEIVKILDGVGNPPLAVDGAGPRVLMIVGVNGAGKTTTIGKLTHQLMSKGKKVLLGAGDTFRAAAVEQLEVWAKRNEAPIVKGAEGADPASVLYDAVSQAKDDGMDVVICDTAGRLHTKVNLMEELKKVHRAIDKALPGAPHEVLLVLDATVGQNAIAQAKQFGAAVDLTGIVLTKLDGTAKGGVVIGIADELGVPVRYIGVGEKIDDLRRFDAHAFVDALFGEVDLKQTAA